VGEAADGVVVGSAIVKLMEEAQGRADLLEQVGAFVAALKAATRPTPIEIRLPVS
jgi:tryptophan synthase alpha subunit